MGVAFAFLLTLLDRNVWLRFFVAQDLPPVDWDGQIEICLVGEGGKCLSIRIVRGVLRDKKSFAKITKRKQLSKKPSEAVTPR